jgi:guanylate kinase
LNERGRLVIISSPSGAGKTTLARRLLGEFDRVDFSVSYTTRKPRPGERPGVDYHFVGDADFDRMIADGEFAEWAEVHGNRYGTSRTSVELALEGGRDVVFDVDWQGGGVLSDKWPGDSVKIFILPPDLGALESRLRRRATDSEEVIQRRLHKAIEELAHFDEYRYLIVNDELDAAYDILRAVYLVSRLGERATPGDHERAARADTKVDDRVAAHARALIAPAG